MAGEVKFRIEGAREMERLLKQLPVEVANKVAVLSLRAGARPIVKEAKRLVPVRTGDLKRAITSAVVKHDGLDLREVAIGFRRPDSARAHLTEFGTAKQRAYPFMRPALDNTASEALDRMGKALGAGIEREALKLAKKG